MGAYVKKGETLRIELPEGEWVEIKKRYTYGEVKAWKAEQSETAMLAKAITAWNITGEDGQILAINEANLDSIDVAVLTTITEEVARIIRPLAAIKAPLTNTSGLSSEAPAKP